MALRGHGRYERRVHFLERVRHGRLWLHRLGKTHKRWPGVRHHPRRWRDMPTLARARHALNQHQGNGRGDQQRCHEPPRREHAIARAGQLEPTAKLPAECRGWLEPGHRAKQFNAPANGEILPRASRALTQVALDLPQERKVVEPPVPVLRIQFLELRAMHEALAVRL